MKKQFCSFAFTLVILLLLQANSSAQQLPRSGQWKVRYPISQKYASTSNKVFRTSSTCSPDSIVLTRQSEIDSFPINHPGCTVLRELHIDGTNANPAITRLDSLKYVTEVNGFFQISHTSVTSMAALSGMQLLGFYWTDHNPFVANIKPPNISYIGSLLMDSMPAFNSFAGFTQGLTSTRLGYLWLFNTIPITNFSGLESLDSVDNIGAFGLPNLQNLQGLQNVHSCNDIILSGNAALTSVSALSNIKELPYGSLEVSYDGSLMSLNGLQNIVTIGGILNISGSQFTSLSELNPNLDIQHAQNPDDTLRLEWNGNLAACSFTALCNYLSAGKPAIIHDNAPGCNDIAEIQASCGLCNTVDVKTWKGSASDDWNDPLNWTPNAVPQACDSVVIPAGVSPRPMLTRNASIHSLTMEQNTELYFNGYGLSVNGNVNADGVLMGGGDYLTIQNAQDVSISNSSLYINNVSISNYKGALNLSYNSLQGNLTVSDHPGRTGQDAIDGNFITGNFSITVNTTDGNANTYISENGDDFIVGDATIVVNQPRFMSVGGGSTFHVDGNLSVNSKISNYPSLNNITFGGRLQGHVIQLGTEPIRINRATMDKDPGYYLTPDQNVYINNNFSFGKGIVKTAPGKTLVFGPSAGISQYGSSSYVWGPVRKIGSQSFTFPVGDSIYTSVLNLSVGSSGLDTTTVQYFHKNPATAGFDTSLHESSLKTISGKEYWFISRAAGPLAGRIGQTNAVGGNNITLSFDSTHYGYSYIRSLYDLRVAHWDGSQWQNLGQNNITGNDQFAQVTSGAPFSDLGAFTLGFVPTRIPEMTIGSIDSFLCKDHYFKVPVSLDTLAFSNNTFTVQLSDSNGSFANPVFLASKASNHSDTITAYLPSSNISVTGHYKIRVIASTPRDTSVNVVSFTPASLPTVNFTLQGPTPGCVNSGVQKYYASQKEAGVTYTWQLSGGGTMTTNNDTAYVTWTTPGNYTLQVTSSTRCGNGPSPYKSITVYPPPPVDAPALNNIGRWLYASTPLPSGASGYHWFKNNVPINNASGSSYYASEAGNYTVKYYNNCGESPVSNAISFAANSTPQTINFPAITDKLFTDAPFTLNATTSSGLPAQYSIVNGPGSISGNTYTITGTGTVTIRAMQSGDNVYDTAAPVERTFMVSKGSQTITFPAIADQTLGTPAISLNAASSSGLPVTYFLVSGPATLSGNVLYITGVGSIAVRASQSGDNNYQAATVVDRVFCVRVNSLTSITGPQYICPGQMATYSVNGISGITYSWRLTNGTTFPSSTNSVSFSLSTPGTYTLVVSGSGPCGAPTANATYTINVINPVTPGVVSNMLPASGSTNLALPLTISWIPGNNALTYDIYIWDAEIAQPSTPFAANLTAVSYTIASGALAYNKTYKWKVVTKNACLQTDGPVQDFRLKPLPDLVVSNVQIPSSAFSGQTITISWKVTNIGPGNTTTNQSWADAVFLSFDTIPNFGIPPNTSALAWSQLDFPIRPLLIGTKQNVAALDNGQQYTSSIDFTLPLNYSQPLYAYVITHYQPGNNAPLEMSYANDTARAPQAINVTLSPQPDLRVDTVLAPSSVFSGSTVNVTYKVKNYGVLTPAGSQWTDKFYISQSPVFNTNTAIQLKAPKSSGAYYANAPDALVVNNMQLQADSSVTRSMEVVIPNFIFGTYFIHVVTNATNSLYEGAAANNNTNNQQLQVFLTPTPLLTVGSLTVPVTTASVTQPIALNWNIFNKGFNNNIEKNKGHYFVSAGSCTIPCDIQVAGGGGAAVYCPDRPGTSFRDSLGFGSSYWVDKVYLSPDASGLNGNAILIGEVGHGSQDGGLISPEKPLDNKCQLLGTDGRGLNQNTFDAILPGSNHPGVLNFIVPNDLPVGKYYVYVFTNANKTVYEYPGTPQIKRSDFSITVQRPDLLVPSVSVAANSIGGQPVNINYQVRNDGAGSVFNATRKDQIYISTSSVFDATAQLLSTQTYAENIAAGTSVSHTYTHTFPPSTSGVRYFFVITNFDSSFRETVYTNNTSAAANTSFSTAVPNDLVVAELKLSDSVYTLSNTFMRYTVTNNGSGTTAGTWTDSLFISCSSTFNPATSYYIGKRTHNEAITLNNSYSDSFNLSLPLAFDINNCFPATMFGTAYFFVKTNADNVVFEGNSNNNVLGSGARIIINPLVDHIVTSVTGPDTATVGRPYNASWTVKNIGFNPGTNTYHAWYDGFYFSPDSALNNNAVLATYFYENQTLNNGQTYSRTKPVITPNLVTGDYYVFAATNFNNTIYAERQVSNNTNLLRNANGTARRIHVVQPLLPDLIDSFVTVPTNVAVGQPLTLVHTMKNVGAGATYPDKWSNELWLSNDFIPGNAGDIRIAAKNYNTTLPALQSLTDTITIPIDINTPTGNYILISNTDVGNNIIESVDTNNLAFRVITVYRPSPSDLLVLQVTKPDTVYLGYAVDTAKWIISNNSPNNAEGFSTDGFYLSKKTTLDSTATLIGVLNKHINIPALAKDTVAFHPVINNVTEGAYNVLVKTDLLNNIVETDKTNNVGVATGSIYVKVKELKLNIAETNTLQYSTNRFYKLIVPDSLKGSTILLTLKSGDSLTVRNEMFIGLGYVPSPAQFDYKYEIANYGNQQIVMTSVTGGAYYITIRTVTQNTVVQNITLNARVLPFEILNVQSSQGGNIGNVTVKISGSLFSSDMAAKLTQGSTTIPASAVYFTNSTQVYATFNLRGMPLGVYDVSLTKPDNKQAILSNGFTIVTANNGGIVTGGGSNTGSSGSGNTPGCDPGTPAGLNSQLVTEVVIPEKAFAGWPFVIQINYTNPTNYDVPAQVRILYNDKGVPVALTQAGLAEGKTSLYLELAEPGGPPGIIRAGGSGSITVYAKAPVTTPGHTIVNFSLK